jgi:hypothetical protein
MLPSPFGVATTGSDGTTPFIPSVVTVARKYVDKEPEQRPPEAHFREALESLRDIAPVKNRTLGVPASRLACSENQVNS